VNVMDLRRGINMTVDAVISDLKSKASMLSTPEKTKQVMDFSEKVVFELQPTHFLSLALFQ
jgi:hypothetical protein